MFGDWHGNGHYAQRQLKRIAASDRTPDAYLHVGDFGIWKHSNHFLKVVERELNNQGVELWFVDGNHEDFTMLAAYPFDDRGLQKVTNHIFRIPRGYAWNWGGKKLVGLGGAFSIDKRWLKTGVDWFVEEIITETDLEKALANESADILISHEAPFMPAQYLNVGTEHLNFRLTPEEQYYVSQCRSYIAKAIDSLNIKLHLHGHHHMAYTTDFFGTQIVGLDRDGAAFDSNAVEVDLRLL